MNVTFMRHTNDINVAIKGIGMEVTADTENTMRGVGEKMGDEGHRH